MARAAGSPVRGRISARYAIASRSRRDLGTISARSRLLQPRRLAAHLARARQLPHRRAVREPLVQHARDERAPRSRRDRAERSSTSGARRPVGPHARRTPALRRLQVSHHIDKLVFVNTSPGGDSGRFVKSGATSRKARDLLSFETRSSILRSSFMMHQELATLKHYLTGRTAASAARRTRAPTRRTAASRPPRRRHRRTSPSSCGRWCRSTTGS